MRRTWSLKLGAWTTWLWLGGFASVAVRAELIYFAGGGQAQLPASRQGSSLRLETPDGHFDFPLSAFRKVVPGFWPEREWAERRQSALAGGVEARYQAAWWALENGLTPEAVAMVREAQTADPSHPPVARMIAALHRLDRQTTDPDLETVRRTLGGDFEEARGPHVLLLHQHSAADAAERIDLLERVTTTYYLILAAEGLELPVARHRLVSAWFAQKDAYLSFLRSTGAVAFLSTRGYYHPTLDAVIAYDARTADDQVQARTRLAARRLELAGELSGASNRPESRLRLDRSRTEHDRQQLLLDLDRRAIDLGTAAHEMVHQLVTASGLAPSHDAFPLWLHEGLAAQFEVVRGGRWAGVGRVHDLRLPDWRAIQPPPRLLPLLRDVGFGRGYRRDLYAESWAMVYYLRHEHPREFLTFLDYLRVPPTDAGPSPEQAQVSFLLAFGANPADLEFTWNRFLSTLQTPLEAGQRFVDDKPFSEKP